VLLAVLVLASALLHAFWNALLKKAANLEAASVGILATSLLATAFLALTRALVVGAGLVCTASFLLYLQALALGGAGLVATLRNTSVVFAVCFARLLGERPTTRQWAGACLVTAGAMGLACR